MNASVPIAAWTLGIVTLLAACGDTVSPVVQPVGGPDNPAEDGSYTQAIASQSGIASLEPVMLGGVEQWILIRGYDTSNPVLVYLHGGPGSPAIPYARHAFGGLERNFTVVTWDQRGCGKSYDPAIGPESITLDQLLSDTRELITMMNERFGAERVYLLGASWGSVLGALTARDRPELLYAYVGVGQFVNAEKTMRIAHEAAMNRAVELGNQAAIDELAAIRLHPEIEWDKWGQVVFWLEAFGFGDLHDTSLYPVLIDSLMAATEYTAEDFANQNAWEQLYWSSPLNAGLTWVHGLDLPGQVPRLAVPVFFMSGRFDYKTPGALVEEYLAVLEAPGGKQMIWFENSAHAVMLEESKAFSSAMIDTVLPGHPAQP